MTGTRRTIVMHWRGMATVCAIIVLSAVSWILWQRIDSSDRNYRDAVAEADRRGDAVNTLADDVRALRAQVQAAGKTPVAPDPSKAVADLPSRSTVPVPIPGERGATGAQGSPGPTGAPGKDGSNGTDGQTCPAGYSLQAPDWDPDALICRKDGAPTPEPSNGNGHGTGLLSAGLDPSRRQYA
jgi:hypothetical protein